MIEIRNKAAFVNLCNEPYGIDMEDLEALYMVGYEFVIAGGKLIDILKVE